MATRDVASVSPLTSLGQPGRGPVGQAALPVAFLFSISVLARLDAAPFHRHRVKGAISRLPRRTEGFISQLSAGAIKYIF